MQKINYPKQQMHRFPYTKLAEKQILEKLAAVRAGPTSRSELSGALAGKTLRIVADGGLELAYAFKSRNALSLAEGGGAPVQAGYGALDFSGLVLFSHLVPGTQRGYHVIVDPVSNLATVFEFWFSGYTDARELQREVHFGYVDVKGQEPPISRHGITNRIEGKGFHWRQDTGVETIELFPSVLYSNFVELTRFGGELSYCAPSDYIRIDDDRYIYSRVEAEFAGTMTLYVLDLNTVRQAGLRLGFNETDALEYYLFRGHGEIVGQIAVFSPLDNHGEKIDFGARPRPQKKGERLVYRPLLTNPAMSKAQVEAVVAQKTSVFPAREGGMGGHKLPDSELLVGKSLTVRYDDGGPVITYRFDDKKTLHWRREGESQWHQETYNGWEPAPGVVFFGHLLGGAVNHDCMEVVIDFDNALTSCVQGWLGTPYMANEAARKTWFGVVEMEGLTPPQYRRHQFTDELVGRALTWNYSPGLTSMHVYTTPYSFSWVIFLANGAGGLEWSGPAQYVKIRDELYLFNWLEEACNGTLGTLVINTRTMHDCGIGYHCGTEGLSLSAIGAYSRNAGQFDVKKFYGPKAARGA
jgi:hypothetical protein